MFNLFSFTPMKDFPKCEKDHVRDKARFPVFPLLGQILTTNFFNVESHRLTAQTVVGCEALFQIFYRKFEGGAS